MATILVSALQKLTQSEFEGLVIRQKERQSSLLRLTEGINTVETEGSGNNKKIVLYADKYLDNKGQEQTFPCVNCDGKAVALSALAGKDTIVMADGTLVARSGIAPVGSTYEDILDALKSNGYKFNLKKVNGRCNGIFRAYGVVTK
jgi:hypothetical protein